MADDGRGCVDLWTRSNAAIGAANCARLLVVYVRYVGCVNVTGCMGYFSCVGAGGQLRVDAVVSTSSDDAPISATNVTAPTFAQNRSPT